jgi:hypothetical protein
MDIIFGFIGIAVGWFIGHGNRQVINTELSNEQRAEYEEKIKYYKDLCKWHVDQIDKLKENLREYNKTAD